MEKDNNKYLSVLNHFVAKESLRYWMREPFNAKGKSMATNGYCLVATPVCDTFINLEEKIDDIYPMVQNRSKSIKVSELKEKLASFPMVDCYVEEEEECEACGGKGYVDFIFEYGGKTYKLEEDCPICKGEGKKKEFIQNGSKTFDFNKVFQIGKNFFLPERVRDLIFVAETVGVDEIILANQTTNEKPSLFLIGEVELIITSAINVTADNIAATVV